MAEGKKGQTQAAEPWWLGGSEVCSFCLQIYALEMEVHCLGCDRALCPACMKERREAGMEICVGCQEEEEGRKDSPAPDPPSGGAAGGGGGAP